MAFKDEIRKSLIAYFSKDWKGTKSMPVICDDICDMLPDKSYEDGLNEGWAYARKVVIKPSVGGFTVGALDEIFGNGETGEDPMCLAPDAILSNYNGFEAAAKIKAYEEEKNKIHIGDEVFSYAFNDRGIVTKIGSNNIITIVCDKISSISTSIDKVYKTGKSYPQIIEYFKFLEQYSNDKNERSE